MKNFHKKYQSLKPGTPEYYAVFEERRILREQHELDGGAIAIPIAKGKKKIPVRGPGIGIEGVRVMMKNKTAQK